VAFQRKVFKEFFWKIDVDFLLVNATMKKMKV